MKSYILSKIFPYLRLKVKADLMLTGFSEQIDENKCLALREVELIGVDC